MFINTVLRKLARRGLWSYCLILTISTTTFLIAKMPPQGYRRIAAQNQLNTLNSAKLAFQREAQRLKPPCDVKNTGSDGEIHFNKQHHYTEQELEVKFPEVKVGGHWSPANCKPSQELAVVIPFRDLNRDRHKNLMVLIHQLHVLLQHQQLHYHIYVVHQNGTTGWFNKGILMNKGFLHARNSTQSTCLVFHDVDVVPVDYRNSYMCGSVPRHLSEKINNDTKPAHWGATGGALCLSTVNFTTVNGFSNLYWGWGYEDSDLYSRFVYHKLKLAHANFLTARYLHLPHKRSYKSTKYRAKPKVHLNDGLNSLDSQEHKLLEQVPHTLFTWLNYHITQPS